MTDFIRFGVDVSSFQGDINWEKVKPHVLFVFCRSWMGDVGAQGKADPTFNKARVQALRKAGIPFGPYCFARNGNISGKVEARRFVNHAKAAGWGKPGDLPGVLDIETGKGGKPGVKFVREFAAEYRRLCGHRGFVYTGSFWRDALRNPMVLMGWKLYLSAYTSSWRKWIPRAWKKPFIWQYTDHASVAGISGHVDGDRWLRSKKMFEKTRLKHKI